MAGLAISMILLAVILLAAIAFAIAASSKSGTDDSILQKNKLLATTIVSQAEQVKTGVATAMANGGDPSTIDYSYSGNATNFTPASAGIASQVAPVQATTVPASLYWIWNGQGALAHIANVGTSAGSYFLEIDPLTQGVCQQINQGLFNDTSIPTVTSDAMLVGDGSDATGDPAYNGKQEGCFFSPGHNKYFYYKIMIVQ